MAESVKKLQLNNLKNCQKSLSRLIRQFHEEIEPNIPKYRTIGFLLKILIESYQFDKKTEIEERLTDLERKVEDLKK